VENIVEPTLVEQMWQSQIACSLQNVLNNFQLEAFFQIP